MTGNAFITQGLPIALFIIMIGMGLSLTAGDFKQIHQRPKATVVGTALQLVAVPLLGFAIAWAIGGGITGAGIVLIACMPGGTTANILTYMAKGNLALSLTLTVLASVLTVLTIPAYMDVALEIYVGKGESLSLPFAKTLLTMLVIVIIPVLIGMLIRRKKPEFARKAEPIISRLAIVVLVGVIVAISVSERDSIVGWLAHAWIPALLLGVLAAAVGMLLGRVSGLSPVDTLTASIGMCIKNSTLALTIALSILKSSEIALPSLVYGVMMYPMVAGLCWYGRKLAAREGR